MTPCCERCVKICTHENSHYTVSGNCDPLWKNRPLAANIEFTLREFKVQWSIRELRSCALLLTRVTAECVGLPLCNVRFLYAYFQAIVRPLTEPEVPRVQNLCSL